MQGMSYLFHLVQAWQYQGLKYKCITMYTGTGGSTTENTECWEMHRLQYAQGACKQVHYWQCKGTVDIYTHGPGTAQLQGE